MNTIELIIIIVVFALFFISGIATTIIIFYRRRWNYSYVVLENVDGSKYTVSRRGKCRLISFGDGGEELFYLRDLKKWRVAYGKRIAKNQIMWVIGQDGYWYNSDFTDFDKTLMQIGVTPIDRDMRYAYASVRKGLENRYNKQTFMEKYGTLIAFGMLFLCIIAMIGFMYFNFSQQKKIIVANNEGAKTSKEVMQIAKDVIQGIADLKNGQSGIKTPENNIPIPILPNQTTT